MNDMAKNLLLWVIIAVVLLTVFQSFNPRATAPSDVAYSDFAQQVGNGGASRTQMNRLNGVHVMPPVGLLVMAASSNRPESLPPPPRNRRSTSSFTCAGGLSSGSSPS